MIRRADRFTFTPNDGVIEINGEILADGNLHGIQTLSGANKQPYPIVVEGVLSIRGFTGTYATPRCRWQVQLHAALG